VISSGSGARIPWPSPPGQANLGPPGYEWLPATREVFGKYPMILFNFPFGILRARRL
jgi:hypothetical protein